MKLSIAFSALILLVYRPSSASASKETVNIVDEATYPGFEDHLKDDTKHLRGLQDGEGSFIITFADDEGDRRQKAQGLARAFGGSIKYVYGTVLNGAAMTVPNAAAAKGLALSPLVESIEVDGKVYASAVGSWGLDRVNQCSGRDGSETKASGSGVKMYIIDTGLRADHVDFNGRVQDGCSSGTGYGTWDDRNGHGTHVGSTACGTTYGIANGCIMCAVKVLGDDGSGSWSNVIAGIDFAANNCGSGNKCVANMSLGGGASSSVDTAVNNAVARGLVFAVAAGNSSRDACGESPARAASAITVGSTTSSDGVSSFSNYGTCVDVYAPGSSITAAWWTSETDTRTISGTSMASPHVAGIAAGMLNSGIPAADVSNEMKNTYKTVIGIDCNSPGVSLVTNMVAGCTEVGECPPISNCEDSSVSQTQCVNAPNCQWVNVKGNKYCTFKSGTPSPPTSSPPCDGYTGDSCDTTTCCNGCMKGRFAGTCK